MANFDWDKWNLGWALGLPKNQMWAKIRDGKNAKSGEPTFQYEEKPDTSSADPKLADVLAEHRFISPAVGAVRDSEHCFCGWAGADHVQHLKERIEAFLNPPQSKAEKKSAKKADE